MSTSTTELPEDLSPKEFLIHKMGELVVAVVCFLASALFAALAITIFRDAADICVMFEVAFATVGIVFFAHIMTKGPKYWAPMNWVRAKLPTEFYPRDDNESRAFKQYAAQMVNQKADACARHWESEARYKVQCDRLGQELLGLGAAPPPVSTQGIRDYRLKRSELEQALHGAECEYSLQKQSSKLAVRHFYRVWNVFLLLRMQGNLSTPDDVLNAAKSRVKTT